MDKMLDCSLEISEFELQSRYCIHFGTNTLGKSIEPSYLLAMGWIVALLFLYKKGFGIELLTKVDLPLNKESKSNTNVSQLAKNVSFISSVRIPDAVLRTYQER